MKRRRFNPEQITTFLHQVEVGLPVKDLCRKHGCTEKTFYRWKKQYAGMGTNEVRELRETRRENERLRKLVADLKLDKQMLQEVLKKKVLTPSKMRKSARWLQDVFGVSERRFCDVIPIQRATLRYEKVEKFEDDIRMAIKDIAQVDRDLDI